MLIGIDDTDSREGMCTTYLGALLIEELKQYSTILSYPLLVRLNPTVPFKTRGNASICISIDTSTPNKIIKHVINTISKMAALECQNTNPGVVFVQSHEYKKVEDVLNSFFYKAVHDIITIDEAESIISNLGLHAKGFKNGRGLIGALAACGAMLNLDWDHTFEHIAYRYPDKWGTLRVVDNQSFFNADNSTYSQTWDTVDLFNKKVICVPRSPDPVLFGIRGDDAISVSKAADMIVSESIHMKCTYRTNQGTDMHLIHTDNFSTIKNMHSYITTGTIISIPKTFPGGHTIFSIKDKYNNYLECAAFEPTKNFRLLIRQLIIGDRVQVYGSFINNTLNIEKIEILHIHPLINFHNPICPKCSKRMKSAGRNQGYKCKKCGTKSNDVVKSEIQRDIKLGIYEVPPCARRHLAKPLIRIKKSNSPLFPSR